MSTVCATNVFTSVRVVWSATGAPVGPEAVVMSWSRSAGPRDDEIGTSPRRAHDGPARRNTEERDATDGASASARARVVPVRRATLVEACRRASGAANDYETGAEARRFLFDCSSLQKSPRVHGLEDVSARERPRGRRPHRLHRPDRVRSPLETRAERRVVLPRRPREPPRDPRGPRPRVAPPRLAAPGMFRPRRRRRLRRRPPPPPPPPPAPTPPSSPPEPRGVSRGRSRARRAPRARRRAPTSRSRNPSRTLRVTRDRAPLPPRPPPPPPRDEAPPPFPPARTLTQTRRTPPRLFARRRRRRRDAERRPRVPSRVTVVRDA